MPNKATKKKDAGDRPAAKTKGPAAKGEKAKVQRVTCRVCGQTYSTAKRLARLKKEVNLPDKIAETCPKCRGNEFRVAMGRTLGTAKPLISR